MRYLNKQAQPPVSPSPIAQVPHSESRSETRLWSPRKWISFVAVFLILQILFFLLLLNKKGIQSRQPTIWQQNEFIPDVSSQFNPTLNAFIESFDPRLFGGPHQHGISAFLWNLNPTTEYTPHSSDFPFFSVTPRDQRFQRKLEEILSSINDDKDQLADIYIPSIKIREPRPLSPITHSRIHFLDSEQSPWLQPKLELPIQPWSGSLKPTVIQALVGEDGRVLSALLLSSSGLPTADEQAIHAISTLRLLPKQPTLLSTPIYLNPWKNPETILMTVTWATIAPSKSLLKIP